MPRKLIPSLCLAIVGSAATAAAQTSTYFDAGGARVTYGDTVDVTAGTVSAGASLLTPRATFAALVAGSTTQQSRWTIFGAADAAVFSPGIRSLRGELHARGSGTTYGSSSGSGLLIGGGRLHVSRTRAGAWLGLGAGTVIDPIGARGIRQAEAGLWAQLGAAVGQLVVLPVRINGGIDYTDTEATMSFGGAQFDIAAVGGFRSNIAGYDDFPNAWASVNATAWLRRSIGVTAGAGSYPADIGQNLPSATYLSLGIRMAPRRIVSVVPPLRAEVSAADAEVAAPAVTVSAAVNGKRTISFRAGSAQRVEIMGDFTDWTPATMAPAPGDGTWTISLPLSSGVHQINVRLDGGEWIVPAGLTAVRDEFGGSVGILLVP